jgi:hypothetical protein
VDLSLKLTLSKPADSLKVRIYTVGFRRILEIPAGAANTRDVTVTVPRLKLSRLAAGTYYVIVTGVSTSGDKAVSKPLVLVVLK